jgi:hypothetical protein
MSFFAVLFALLLEQLKPLPRDNWVHESLARWVRWTDRNFDAWQEASYPGYPHIHHGTAQPRSTNGNETGPVSCLQLHDNSIGVTTAFVTTAVCWLLFWPSGSSSSFLFAVACTVNIGLTCRSSTGVPYGQLPPRNNAALESIS